MKQKGVLVLTLVTVAAVVVAALALKKHDAGAAHADRQKLFVELDGRVNDVAEITVQKGGKSATVKREGGAWRLTDRGGYPAKFDQVKQTVVRLAELAIEEEKTARTENHEKLGLKLPDPAQPAPAPTDEASPESPSPPESEAALITLKDAGGNALAALVVGKTEWRGSTQKVYVRRANEDQVYLCSGRLDINADPGTWIDKDLLKLDN